MPDDNPEGPISRLADRLEAEQLKTGHAVLGLSRAMLESELELTADEFAYVAQRLAECLTDALRVAESRGQRLGMSDEFAEPLTGPTANASKAAMAKPVE